MLHTGLDHGLACLSVRQRHSDAHQRTVAFRTECRFNVVIGSGVRQVHAFHMHDSAMRYEFQVFTRDVELMTLSVRPFVRNLPPGLASLMQTGIVHPSGPSSHF